jgi:DNA-binding SARP family transcriptional activator
MDGRGTVIYGLLGELEIRQGGGLVDLPGGAGLIVLAALLINANRRMSRTELIRTAWDTGDVEEAQLNRRVKAVRDLLATIGRGNDLITHPRFGYEMRVAEDDVDVLLFRRLVRDAAEAGEDGRTEDEISSLRGALRLWRGPHPLANVPSEAFRQDKIALEQRHRRAAVRLFEIELARGNHERILDELILTAGYYPSDQRLCEQLMLAENRCGHPTDAIQAYEYHREALAEETGRDPDALLRTLHFAIARGDADAIAEAESALMKRAGQKTPPVRAGTSSHSEGDKLGLLFRIYIPSGRLYAPEAEKLISLFRSWLSGVRRHSVQQVDYQTSAGKIYEFFSPRIHSDLDLSREFIDFSARYGKEMRRLSIDLRHEREQRILAIRHTLESELLDHATDPDVAVAQIASLVSALVPDPTAATSLAILESVRPVPEVPFTLNINQQFVSAVKSHVIQNIQGTVNLAPQARELLQLIGLYGKEQAVQLESAVYELEDPDARPADRLNAKQRLKIFLGRLRGVLQDVTVDMLEKYLEGKIGI